MAFNLDSITSGTRLRPPRIILLGVEKIGKSTFAAGSDRPIFIPIKGEEGIDSISVPQFPTCRTVQDIEQCFTVLYNDKHDYGTAVIDSASALEPLIWADVCKTQGNVDSIEKVGGGYAKGYSEAIYYWRRITEALDALRNERNMASILIGHVNVRRFDDPCAGGYDQYHFDIQDGKSCSAVNTLFRWADVILFCNTKVVAKEVAKDFGKVKSLGIDISGGQRFLYTQKQPSHPGGGRGVFGQLPYELPLNWNNFMDAVSAASNK